MKDIIKIKIKKWKKNPTLPYAPPFGTTFSLSCIEETTIEKLQSMPSYVHVGKYGGKVMIVIAFKASMISPKGNTITTSRGNMCVAYVKDISLKVH